MTRNNEPSPPVTRRRSATQEDLEARRTEDYAPPASPKIIRPGGYSRTVPPLHNIPQQDEEQDYPDPPRRARTSSIYKEAAPTRQFRRTRFHPLLFVGLGLFVMIIGWLSFSALSSWWTIQQDDWHYGRPRTFQTDAVVGHGDSASNPSHFIAVNLDRKIIIIEIPGGNVSKTQIYYGPTLLGDGQDLTPVTLSFEDTSGNGKLDMIVHVGTQEIIFTNNGQKFLPPQQQ